MMSCVKGMGLGLAVAAGVSAMASAPSEAQIRSPQGPELSFHLGMNDESTPELQLRYLPDQSYWGWARPIVAASISEEREGWIGAGLAVEWDMGQSGIFGRFAVMPGLYEQGNGADLGGRLQFRSAIELGWDRGGMGHWSVILDHRSNAGIRSYNPGLNTLSLGYSLRLN